MYRTLRSSSRGSSKRRSERSRERRFVWCDASPVLPALDWFTVCRREPLAWRHGDTWRFLLSHRAYRGVSDRRNHWRRGRQCGPDRWGVIFVAGAIFDLVAYSRFKGGAGSNGLNRSDSGSGVYTDGGSFDSRDHDSGGHHSGGFWGGGDSGGDFGGGGDSGGGGDGGGGGD